jgi:MraZ protein
MFSLDYTYECKIDDKGRVLLPNRLKGELAPNIPNGFILKRGVFNSYLELWPKSEWDKQTIEINQLNRFNRKNVEFIRKFMAGLKPVELDGMGRMLIPKDLLAFAGIDKDIVMASMIDRIEIWDKTKYEAELKGGEDIDKLAEEVMGGKTQTQIQTE